MAKFEMDTEFIRKLAAILEETGLGEIELADGERRIRVARPADDRRAPQRRSPWPPIAAPPPPAAVAAGRRRRRRRPQQASRRGEVADGRHRLPVARARQAGRSSMSATRSPPARRC